MKLCYHCMQQISNERLRYCTNCGKSLEPEPQPERFLKAGTVLGRKFVVGYPLGAGGFGNTYVGWDTFLLRKVAIKEFYPEQYCVRREDGQTVTASEERLLPRYQRGLRQFLEEARKVAALHEVRGVVEITNFFEENGTGYIVMEYLEGMDVRNILKESGDKKDYEWCRRVILTVLYTLKEIHKKGVLHRDVAPDNIFVTKEGIIKLIDFGAAKSISALENGADIMLKAGYAPIEQYSREFLQGPYTDLYAVAALFYRMLTGQKPIPAPERLEHPALITPSEMGISIPEQAELAMMVCLNVEPEYRLQSAEEFMEALDGKFFLPVYEPEWILPKIAEKKGLGGRIGSLPVAAKAAICFGCICLVACAAFGVRHMVRRAGEAAVLDSKVVVMQDLQGKPEEEVTAYVASLNRAHPGWEIGLDMTETVFDLTKASGTVYAQSVEAGTVLYDPEKEEQGMEAEGLTCDADGNLKGTISCTLYSNEKLRYGEISGLNAYELAKKLGVDIKDKEHFVEKEGTERNAYFEISSIDTDGVAISDWDLCKEENQEKELDYSEDIRIYYYATDFFYWKKLPDFAKKYGKIEAVPEQSVYRWSDETKKQKTGKRSLADSSLVDDGYWTLSGKGYEEGDIAGQTVAPGETYDESHPGDTPLKIQVIGKVLKWEGKTGSEFAEELNALGYLGYIFDSEYGSNANPEWKISKVIIYKNGEYGGLKMDENGKVINETMSYFKWDSKDVILHIIVEKPQSQPQPQPQSQPQPQPQSQPQPQPQPQPKNDVANEI